MAKENKSKTSYVINDTTGIGDIKVSAEVVMAIAAVSALEVKGVHAMQGSAANEIVTMLGFQNLSRGVRIDITDHTVKVTLAVILDYGYSIPKISAQVQEKVKSSIETMMGLEVVSVNVRIAGVNLDKAN
ncbi:MAG: Asp23/Gls24 family envelope stress response protein [Lachnospiraceae bacterium]